MQKKFTYDEVREASLKYFNNDELAAEVFAGKYALRDFDGNLLESTPTDMHHRLAMEFARIEKKYENPIEYSDIFLALSRWDIVAQGSPMSAIGNPYQFQSLSNCFVIESPHDSYGGILKADQEQAQIMKRRGGVGFDISTIRPKSLRTSNAARTTDGIGVFMKRFSSTCREVAQGGRRGALMLTISVHHPEIRTFINIKRNREQVTGANISIRLTDEFMQAVKEKKDVELRFPVEKNVKHTIESHIDANELWNEIIEAAHESAEPGLLFWDTVQRFSPADAYSEFGYGSTSTNPCLSYDTKVAVADGRGYVEIGKLAAEGFDVPVYAVNDQGKIIIKKMRNPRLTGHNVPVFKVTIEGGHTFKATGNHKMIMNDQTEKRIDELKYGDQLMISRRTERTLVEIGTQQRQINPNHYVMIENYLSSRSEHRMIWNYHNGPVPRGNVIHHIDYNSKNNHINNLQCMNYVVHKELHAKNMRGDKNPMRKIKADPVRLAVYSAKMSKRISGMNNPRAYDVSNQEIHEHIISLTKKVKRRITIKEWYAYKKENNLPHITRFRKKELGSLYELSCSAAKELGFKNVEVDTRVQRTLQKALKQGYDANIVNNCVFINRICEWCNKQFTNEYGRREIAFCSHSCSNLYANRKTGKNEARKSSLQTMHAQKAVETRKKILDLYTQLRFELNREPKQDELRVLCKQSNVPYRTGTKNGFKNFNDIKQHALNHNHRVISVEYVGTEDVFNGTVDDVHNFCIGGWKEKNNEQIQLHTKNCGEITLSPYDSCRLLLVNLNNFVDLPFTSKAKFNFKRFNESVKLAQRLMDDLVDLELEAVDKIIKKIHDDPEPDDVKAVEFNLWKKIKNAGSNGRRTGLGITGLGDAFAGLGIKYGSDESVLKTEEIYRALALGAYRSSIQLAKERGPFPIFSHDVEHGHEFIEQILNEDPKLRIEYEAHGRRNIALTTTAPAGSTSILTQTTSGCEPAFKLHYKRRRKITDSDSSSNIDFVDNMGDKWQEYLVYHHGFKRWMDVTGKTLNDLSESPYANATANDIDWLKKVDIQAAAQKWICHSISNTTNVPNDTSVDTIKKIYMHGWETGCKGVTVYRDGARDGVLVDTNEKRSESTQPSMIIETHAPKRIKELECDIHRATVAGEAYLVLVGLYNDKPYEVFCGLQEHVEIPKKTKRGFLIKNGKQAGIATYNLKIPIGDDDEIMFKNIVNLFDNPVHGSFSRTISLVLRHGVPVQYLVEQLRKDKSSDMTSFSSVIARVLSKHYIPDGTNATTFEKQCTSCGSIQLAYQSGCVTCMNCGNSRCA